MNSLTLRVLFTGGGSGGHVYPLLAVIQALRKLSKDKLFDLEMNYLGPRDAYIKILSAYDDIHTETIPTGKIRRYLSVLTLFDIPKIFFGVIAALFKVFWIMPDIIFSKGGSGSLQVVIAGWFYRIPVMIHESDASPGLNNLLSAYFSSRIAVSFDSAMQYFNPKKTAWVGTPIREELISPRPSEAEAKENLGFNPSEPLALVLGGSQGSDRINKFILSDLKDLVKEMQILHQTGASHHSETEKLSRAALIDVAVKTATKSRYKAVPYLKDDLMEALTAADIVIARAGSGTIFEISAFGKPAILIPLREAANDHQRINAHEFAKTGAAIIIEEANLLPGIFLGQLKKIIHDPDTLNKMGLASGKFFKPQAAEVIAEELLRLS